MSLVARTLVSAAPRLVSVRSVAAGTRAESFDGAGHSFSMSSRRRLPHVAPQGKWLFVTWHLHGSLPHGVYPPPDKASSGRAFVWMDRYLDHASTGPLYLRQPPIARIVIGSLLRGVELGHYDFAGFVVMANHVHVLLDPKISPSRLLQSLKGFTAREANRMLGRTGETFWQAESFDHWVRNEQEYLRIVAYIENNPVKAGLVGHAEDYPWSSANPEQRLDTIVEAADTSVRATAENPAFTPPRITAIFSE